MYTIEDQLDLERTMQDRGAYRYTQGQRKAEGNGRGADLDYSRQLTKATLLPLVNAITAFTEAKGPASRGKARILAKRVSPEAAAYITLKCLFNSFTMQERVVQVANRIGQQIEDEVRFSRFREIHADYYDKIIADFKRKGTKDYRFIHRVLTNSANKLKDEWVSWSGTERVDLGVRMLDLVMQVTDIVERKSRRIGLKQETYLRPTSAAQEWISTHEDIARLLFPDKMPCIIPPDPWTSLNQGGYYSPGLRQTTPMIKVSSARQRRLLEAADLGLVQDSLNIAQSVEWQVNTEVLEVARRVWENNLGTGMPHTERYVPTPSPVNIPKEERTPEQERMFIQWKREAAEVYTQEKERIAKSFQVSRVMRMATTYAAHDRFWYVWYADFRGRAYTATAGFSPQGPDLAKGLLMFREAVPLGKDGLFWLKVSGANRYGQDKLPYSGRVAWVDSKHALFMAAAADPIEHRALWGAADKPWQFLAFLLEYRRIHDLHTVAGIAWEVIPSTIRVGLDGSCNGLQNFSAMLRDPVGGKATNLTPQDHPADIYTEVAKACSVRLQALRGTDPMADKWLAFCAAFGDGGIPRSMAKRPVMTLPYGAKRDACTRYIFQSILEYDRSYFDGANFAAACWLTPVLWAAIGDVVVAARHAMDWLQSCASVMTKAKLPMTWTTMDGFVATQDSKLIETRRVKTQLNGSLEITVGSATDRLHGSRQRNGISPNFVHSQDATHMRYTLRLANYAGITSLDVIHDDFGTHAGNTSKLHDVIREAFVTMYSTHDPLQAFVDAQGIPLPAIPARGALDLSKVKDSMYFFG